MCLLRYEAQFGLSSLWVCGFLAFDSPIASPEELKRPAVIVFDPDKIIWPFKISDVIPPLFIKNKKVILDGAFRHLKLYSQVRPLFEDLHSRGHQLALISQSSDNETICQLLQFFGIDKLITYKEIYPGNKTEHLEAIYIKSEIDYGEMLYLVDQFSEISEMADLGVVCILVGEGGVTTQDFRKGFHVFSTESPEYSYSEDTHENKTIWPFWFELDVTRPIQKKNNIVLDDGFQPLKPFQQVPALLESLHQQGYRLAFINQSPDNQSMENLLEWFDLNKFLTHKMSMHAPRKELIRIISQKFKIDFGDILYLDAEYDEIPDIAEMHVVCIQTGDRGVTMADVEKGLHIFSTTAPDYG